MKISIGNKAFFKISEEEPEKWDQIRDKLTYEIMDKNTMYPKVYQNCGKVGNGIAWIPITRVKDIFPNVELQVTDRRVMPEVHFPKPTFTLRDDQQEIYDKFMDSGEEFCIINGKPGFGKTITALAIAATIGLKTLIVVTNLNIRAMWEKEVKKWFGISPGIIGSGRFELDAPIVIANIQTLAKHSERLSKEFGLVVVDEMHHCVAATFQSFLEFSYATYRIGLSGTLKRKDGLNIMFPDYFGHTVFSPEVANTLEPEIYKFYLEDVVLSGDRNVPWATRANDVYDNPMYKAHIISKSYVMYRARHKVLMVSDRTGFIEEVRDRLSEVGANVYTITGQTPLEEREEILAAIEADKSPCVLAASVSIFSEGVSCNPLSCLIPGCIIGDNESLIEQLVGRIQRMDDGKPSPVVIDTRLGGEVAGRQASTRVRVYNQNGWKTVEMTDMRWETYLKKVLDN